MPIYTIDPCDDGLFPVEPSLRSSIGIGPKVTKAIDAATRNWLDEHPEATTTVEDNSLTNAKLKDGSVNSRTIENESITTDDIADLAITTPKIADDAVTASKITSNAADGLRIMSATQPGVAKVGAGLAMNDDALELDGSGDIATAVTSWLNAHPEATTTVQDGSITTAKLANGSVTTAKLTDGAVTEPKLDSTIRSKMSEVITSNVLFEADSVSVLESDSASTVYIFHVVYTANDVMAGDVYSFSVSSVTGSGPKPIVINLKNSNNQTVRTIAVDLGSNVTVTESDISNGVTYIEFVLYPAKGTGPLDTAAVFTEVLVCRGTSKQVSAGQVILDALEPLHDDIAHIYISNIKYEAASKVVSGTGAYVYENLYVADLHVGDYYEFSIESVTGNTNEYGLYIYVENDVTPSPPVRMVRQTTKAVVSIYGSDIEAGATQVRFMLYPATGTPLPEGEATYTNVRIMKGMQPYRVGDYMQSMLLDSYAPYISEVVRSAAHRGDDIYAPQCTQASYVVARKHRHTIAENDLCKTIDGVYVMWHDTNLSRLGTYVTDTNGYSLYTDGSNYYWYDSENEKSYDLDYNEVSITIDNLTECAGLSYNAYPYENVIGLPYDVLKSVDFGAYKGFAGETILTFAEWVLLCKQLGMEIYVDQKMTYTNDDVAALFDVVNKLGMKDHTSWMIGSFAEADALRSLDPNARLIRLVNPSESQIQAWGSYNTGRGLVFNGNGKETTREQVALGLEAGFEVEAWYVDLANVTEENQLTRIRELVSYGVTGLTLDHWRVDEAFAYLMD